MESELSSGDTALVEQAETPTPGHTAVLGQQFLRFHLFPDTTALLPVHQITEVLTFPVNQIVPIPHMPAPIMGVYNWRGEILWIVDLGHLVGLTPIYQQTSRGGRHVVLDKSNSSLAESTKPAPITYTAIVIHGKQQGLGRQRLGSQITGRKMLGLVVTQVEDMEWCDPSLIQSPCQGSLTPELEPFLRGYWLKSTGDMQVVLDGDSIFARMPNPKV